MHRIQLLQGTTKNMQQLRKIKLDRTTTAARNEIGPLLDELITQLEAEGSATQRAHFNRIRKRLYHAHDTWELAFPIIDLSSCNAMGFHFSNTADALINRILDKATQVVRELEGIPPNYH